LDFQTNQLTTFFTVTGLTSSGEEGLLGMAFDPNYATNSKFYLNFTVPGGAFGNGVTHVSQCDAQALITTGKKKRRRHGRRHPAGERVLLQFDQPQTNHNGGWIGFSQRAGDDHNLYISAGDGGSSNDQGTGHIEPGGNAQSTVTLLGKMLRVHVDPTLGVA